MFAVCATTSLPAFSNGGAKGGRAAPLPSRSFIIAGTPLLPLRRATST
jgi:hypothetical protein